MTRLERLEVHGFRGIVDGSLPFDGGSIVLGGPNGTGKTAFVDALEYFYTGSISTLAGTAGLTVREHAAHLMARKEEVHVAAHFSDPTATATRWLSGPVDSPAALDRHIQRGAHLAFILRRAQVQQFIHAKPAERYRNLADLIGIDRLDRIEMATKRAHDSLRDEVTHLEAELARLDTSSESGTPAPLDEAELVAGANDALAELGYADFRLESAADVPRLRTALLRSRREATSDGKAEAHARFVRELRRSTGNQRLREALAAWIEVTPRRNETSGRGDMVDLLQVLTRGRDYLRRHAEADHCPLCGSAIEARGVMSSLVKQVASLEEVSLQVQRMERARTDLHTSLVDTADRLRPLEAAAIEAGVRTNAITTLANTIAMLQESIRAEANAQAMEMAARLENVLERWNVWAAEAMAAGEPAEVPTDDESQQPLDAALALLEGVNVVHAQSKRAAEERVRREEQRTHVRHLLASASRRLLVARSVYVTFNRVKNEEIQRIYDGLRDDLVRFYDALHPGEAHGALLISMDPKKRGSSDLKIGFFDRDDEDPRAYGSEGHLDSLGLCIFLAFVKRFNGDWPLLVLDDVVTSVDAAHKKRIARLLYDEFGDRQLFITTQDGRWFSDLRAVQAESGFTRVQNLVIESWSLEEGPRLRPPGTP